MMIKKCCGNKIGTPFCPMCGKPVTHNWLAVLFEHIRGNVRNATSELKRAQKGSPSDGEVDYRHEKYVDGRENVLEKWKGFEEALEGLIEDNVDMRKIIDRQDDKVVPFDKVSKISGSDFRDSVLGAQDNTPPSLVPKAPPISTPTPRPGGMRD